MKFKSIYSGYCLIFLLILTLIYLIYNQYYGTPITAEEFVPRSWSEEYNRRWSWRRPWLHGWGNWRPYGYYPAYSGFWQQCSSGTWCPQTLTCNSPACK